MASPQARDKFLANQAMQMYDFDPDGTDPVDVAWVDMQNYRTFVVGLFRSVGTGSVAAFKILANPNSDGSGTDVEVKAHALGSAPDAVGDQIWLECSAEEIMQEANDAGVANCRYVSASIDLATGTDECVVLYIRAHPRFAYDNLTADVIA
jgi:hypothetical protein